MSERELTSLEALFHIMSTIQSLGYKAEARHVTPCKLVATAELVDHDVIVESGAGKGPDSLLGALAESIEHLCTLHSVGESSWHRTGDIAVQGAASQDGLFTSLPRNELVECYKLTSLDQTEELLIPSALLCPAMAQIFDLRTNSTMQFLSRYSSNSGIAFGCTEVEALLHGALEVIERHILSLFFISVCGISPRMELYKPSEELLQYALMDDPVALEAARSLQIIIIKDVLSVYFALAFPKAGPGPHHISPIGSGCSLDIAIATQRAVTEQFQSQALYDADGESADKLTLDLISCSIKLKNLIDFAPIRTLTLPTLPLSGRNSKKSVSTQLQIINDALGLEGKKIFHRTVTRLSTNSIVSQTYIPGLERFNIIRNGSLVVPQHVLRRV